MNPDATIEITPSEPLVIDTTATPEVRIIGSTIIARVSDCMLETPRPATPILRKK